jgi:hypothetical protein
MSEVLSCDYLVIGAGASGLAFVDELINHDCGDIIIVDKRYAVGGHWNDCYPYVRLHAPSASYGVNSLELSNGRIDNDGHNKGFQELATGVAINTYFQQVLEERLKASGKVRFLPCTNYVDGKLINLLNGQASDVIVRRKLVNAALHTNSVPKTHTPKFDISEQVDFVSCSSLPDTIGNHQHFTVIGAGKTGMDTCVWLLSNGVHPDNIRWVVPRDSWLVNRARVQTTPDAFLNTMGLGVSMREAMANENSIEAMALALEKAGCWLRLDHNVKPQMYHFAIISEAEIHMLRTIKNIVRMGRVSAITDTQIVLERGQIDLTDSSEAVNERTLFIDCSASAVGNLADTCPIFSNDKINLQWIRYPLIPFSMALIAFMEGTMANEGSDKLNSIIKPLPMPHTLTDYFRYVQIEMMNSYKISKIAHLNDWVKSSRLDGSGIISKHFDPSNEHHHAMIGRIKAATIGALQNLPKVTGSL